VEKSEETYRNGKNPFRNVVPFIKELKTWLKAYKNRPKLEEKRRATSFITSKKSVESFDSPQKMTDFDKILFDYKEKRSLISLDNTVNEFQEFMMKPSLPRFSLLDNETGVFEEKKSEVKEEKKETPKKEKKLRILQNKEKKIDGSRISLFEKKLKEIANNTLNMLATQKSKVIERNPLLEFKIEISELTSIFASG